MSCPYSHLRTRNALRNARSLSPERLITQLEMPNGINGQDSFSIVVCSGAAHEIADLKILHVTPFLDHFASDLVSEHHAGRRRRAAPDHVLVGSAGDKDRGEEPSQIHEQTFQPRAAREVVGLGSTLDGAGLKKSGPAILRLPRAHEAGHCLRNFIAETRQRELSIGDVLNLRMRFSIQV